MSLPRACLTSLALLCASHAAAQDKLSEPQKTLLEADLARALASARLEALKGRAPRGHPPKEDGSDALAKALKDSRLFAPGRAGLEEALDAAALRAANERAAAEKAWREVAGHRLEVETRRREVEAYFDCKLADAPRWWPAGSSRTWMLACVAFASLAWLMLAAYEWRHTILRRLRSASWGARLLLVAGGGAAGGLGAVWLASQGDWWSKDDRLAALARADDEAVKEARRLRDETKKLDAAAVAAKEDLAGRYDDLVRGWAKRLGFATPEDFEAVAGRHGGKLSKLSEDSHVARRLDEDARKRQAEAKELDARVEAVLAESKWVPAGRLAASTAYVSVLLGLWWVSRWMARKGATAEADRCPRCLDVTRLVVGPDFVTCKVCKYRFPVVHVGQRRLCFPTHGVTGSGKTHWLLECYFLMTRRDDVPAAVTFEAIESEQSKRTDAELKLLHEKQTGPAGTNRDLPYPLLFTFRDRDPDHEGVLLNLFDFAGELTALSIDASQMRARALQMQGVLILLDPTWPRHDKAEQRSVEPQREAFERFVADVRRARRKAGLGMDVPVAVCLTKLDLIPTRSLYSSDALPWLEMLRVTKRERVDLATLHRRSDLARGKLDVLFPGWPIARALQSNFGNDFLFFPLTPAGLEEDDETLLGLPPGPDNLRGRQLVPFGVVEPVLWLLHKHGYRVFD